MHSLRSNRRLPLRAIRWRRALPGLALLGCVAASGEPRAASAGDDAAFERRAAGCRVVAARESVGAPLLAGCGRAAAEVARLLGQATPPGLVYAAAAPGADSVGAAPAPALAPQERWLWELRPDESGGEMELGNGSRISPLGYAAHESAHRMATAILFPADSGVAAAGQYGSPLPDWLDEGIAMLTEPGVDQRARLGLLFDGSMIYALPLRRHLYMAHPALSGAPAGGQLRRTFYGQSLAFALFIQERAGATGLRALVASLRGGTTQGVALTELPGMPRDGGALEQEWLAWLRAKRGELAAGAAGAS